jgi:hypothetical protein
VSSFDAGTSETQSRNQDTNTWRTPYCVSTGIRHCNGRKGPPPPRPKCRINSWMSVLSAQHAATFCVGRRAGKGRKVVRGATWDSTKMFVIPHFRYVTRELRGSRGGLSTQDRLSLVCESRRIVSTLIWPSYKNSMLLHRTADLAENTQKC